MVDKHRYPRPGALGLLILLLFSSQLAASNLVNFTTVPNTDFAFFGAGGMRGQGTGNIVVTGITGPATQAFLFWQGPTNDTGDTNASVTFNGTPVTGVNIGNSSDNCWGFANSRAYRATVTTLVTGNATYTLANFRKVGPPLADINGVSLVIFFDDGVPGNNRDVVIFNGNDSNQPNTFDAPGWNASLSGINYTTGTVNMRMIVGDGQAFPDEEFRINGMTILPAGNNWQGTTVPDQGTAGATNGGLWDHRTFDITSLLTPGPNTLTIQPVPPVSDCLSMIAAIFDLPAGAAPPPAQPVIVPTLSGTALFLLAGLLAVVALLVLNHTRGS